MEINSFFRTSLLILILFYIHSCIDPHKGLHDKYIPTGDGGSIYNLFRDDVLIDSCYMRNGKRQGIRMRLDTLDSVKIYTNYKDGKKNGKGSAYFFNKKLSYNVNFRNDTMIGECFFYYSTGKINTYEFRRFTDGKVMYQRFYDEKGNTIKSVGKGLIQISCLKDTIYVNEEYQGVATLATPPNTKTVFMYADFTNDTIGKNHMINTENTQKRYFNATFKKPGIYKKIIFWSIEDSITGQIHKGNNGLEIVVIPHK